MCSILKIKTSLLPMQFDLNYHHNIIPLLEHNVQSKNLIILFLDYVSISAGIPLMSYQLISMYMAIDRAVLWSQDIQVVATGKTRNFSAEFWTCCLTHEKNFNAVVMDYKYKELHCMVAQVHGGYYICLHLTKFTNVRFGMVTLINLVCCSHQSCCNSCTSNTFFTGFWWSFKPNAFILKYIIDRCNYIICIAIHLTIHRNVHPDVYVYCLA